MDLDLLFSPLTSIGNENHEEAPEEKTSKKPKEVDPEKKKPKQKKKTKKTPKETEKPKKIEKQKKTIERTRPICKFYQEGRCHNAECTFLHEGPLNKKPNDICRYYLVGACQKGDNCVYSHDFSTFPCRYYHLENECRDRNCRFSHQPITPERKLELMKIYMPDTLAKSEPENPFKKTIL